MAARSRLLEQARAGGGGRKHPVGRRHARAVPQGGQATAGGMARRSADTTRRSDWPGRAIRTPRASPPARRRQSGRPPGRPASRRRLGHHPDQPFGSRGPHQNAARAVEAGFALGDGGPHGLAFERRPGGEADVLEPLRHRIELTGQLAHPAAGPDHFGQHLQAGHQAIAGRRIVREDDVPGGLAAQVEAALAHALASRSDRRRRCAPGSGPRSPSRRSRPRLGHQPSHPRRRPSGGPAPPRPRRSRP